MAEFEYVMQQANRMCNTQTMCSDKCPAYVHRCCCVSVEPRNGNEYVIDYADAEARVLAWAKDHPEPVYPSWEEGWRQLFPDAKEVICPLTCVTGEMYDKYLMKCNSGMICDDCKRTPIPAEIAKKLGIKPIIAK